eukprot:6603258-Alexandrium_andersonii.AAC.1
MAKRTSTELAWGSFWTASQAERGGGDYHDGSVEENVEPPEKRLLPYVSNWPARIPQCEVAAVPFGSLDRKR